MDLVREFFHRLFAGDLKAFIDWGGYAVLMLVIFAETGLLVGFFLPGDSLLVTTGVLVNAGLIDPFKLGPGLNLAVLSAILVVMAIVGDAIGYSIGYRTGPKIFNREKSLFFRPDHLLATQRFYEKHGGKTIVIARFMPFARTFAPVVAGVGKMRYRRFAQYNVFGALGWIVSMMLLGFFLGKVFDAKQIEKVVYLIIVISVLPVAIGALRSHLAAKREAAYREAAHRQAELGEAPSAAPGKKGSA